MLVLCRGAEIKWKVSKISKFREIVSFLFIFLFGCYKISVPNYAPKI